MGANIREVAAAAGVSPATVSRVFSGTGYVSDVVRERVIEAARARQFSPKPYRRRSHPAFCSAVGMVIPDVSNTYYMEVFHGVESVFGARGAEVLIANTDEDPRKEARCLSTLQKAGVDGVIAVPVSSAETYNADRLLELEKSGLPVVLLDRDVKGSGLDGVFMDNFGGAYQSVLAFAACGHRRIATIAGPVTSSSGQERVDGYCAAMRDCGLTVDPSLILRGDFKFDSAYRLTEQLLRRRPRVTAIFAANSRMARGCLAALEANGVTVPGGMGFISCGRLDGNFDRISCVTYPTRAIGRECARLLLEKMTGTHRARGPGRRVLFDMELHLRGSERLETALE